MSSVNSKIEEITGQGVFLYQAYGIWLELVHPNSNSKFEKVLEIHRELFTVLLESLFSSMVITMAALCERKRSDVLSIHSIVIELKNIYPDLRPKIEEIMSPIESEIELLNQLRHKVYAHRDKDISPESVFSLVNMSPERIHCCISSILSALDIINVAVGLRPEFGATMEALNKTREVENSLSVLLS